MQHVVDGEQQLVRAKRLFQEIDRAQARGPHRHLDVRLPRDQYDGRLYTCMFQFFQEFQAAFTGHNHIRKNQIKMFVANYFTGSQRIIANRGFMTGQTKGACQRR